MVDFYVFNYGEEPHIFIGSVLTGVGRFLRHSQESGYFNDRTMQEYVVGSIRTKGLKPVRLNEGIRLKAEEIADYYLKIFKNISFIYWNIHWES